MPPKGYLHLLLLSSLVVLGLHIGLIPMESDKSEHPAHSYLVGMLTGAHVALWAVTCVLARKSSK